MLRASTAQEWESVVISVDISVASDNIQLINSDLSVDCERGRKNRYWQRKRRIKHTKEKRTKKCLTIEPTWHLKEFPKHTQYLRH